MVYVASPSKWHVSYALQAAEIGARIIIEKPLAHCARAAELLRPLCGRGQVFVADHFFFKPGMLALLAVLDQNPSVLPSLARIEFTYYETAGFALGRHQKHGIPDILSHGFALAAAVCNRLSPLAHLFPNDLKVPVATHRADRGGKYAVAHIPTASRVTMSVSLANGRSLTLDLRHAKGAPASTKRLRLLDRAGGAIADADLSESGHLAHGRLLVEALKTKPDLGLDLQSHIRITGWMDQALARARDDRRYDFGTLPHFLPPG